MPPPIEEEEVAMPHRCLGSQDEPRQLADHTPQEFDQDEGQGSGSDEAIDLDASVVTEGFKPMNRTGEEEVPGSQEHDSPREASPMLVVSDIVAERTAAVASGAVPTARTALPDLGHRRRHEPERRHGGKGKKRPVDPSANLDVCVPAPPSLPRARCQSEEEPD